MFYIDQVDMIQQSYMLYYIQRLRGNWEEYS